MIRKRMEIESEPRKSQQPQKGAIIMIRKWMEKRRATLQKMLSRMERETAEVPAGKLRVSRSNGVVQYYHRTGPGDYYGRYIPQKDIRLAEGLAQKDYEQKLLASIREEISAIDKYLKKAPGTPAEQVYAELSEARRMIVRPAVMTDEIYRDRWVASEYEKKDISEDVPELFTDRGERVRSKSEIIIANSLSHEGIPYRYECALRLKGMGTIHPDFTILHVKQRKEIYWEHFGMMDDPAYAANAVSRISCYLRNGYIPGRDLILTFETGRTPLDARDVKALIRAALLQQQ